jgi:hypothetical protein
VKSWLISGGYDPAMPITKTDEGFMVDSNLDPETVLTCIDMADTQGVKVFTIRTKADDTLELTQEVHPGALLSLTMGLYDSVRKSMGKGEYDVGGQVDDYVSALKALTETLPEKTDENFAAVVSTVAPEIEVEKEDRMSTEIEQTTEETVEAVKAEETTEAVTETVEATEEVTAEKAEETAEVVAEEEQAVGAVETEKAADEVVAEEVSGEVAEAAPSDPVAALAALVSELTTSVKSMSENLSNEIKVVERVAAVEETRQTRKGADVDETSASSESKPTVVGGNADLRRRSMLGMRKR